MVRALLAGTKTQTRRALTGPPESAQGGANKRFGNPGERLWVRETFFAWGRWETRFNPGKGRDEWYFVDMTLEAGLAWRYGAGLSRGMGGHQRGRELGGESAGVGGGVQAAGRARHLRTPFVNAL